MATTSATRNLFLRPRKQCTCLHDRTFARHFSRIAISSGNDNDNNIILRQRSQARDPQRRNYAVQSPGTPTFQVFNRNTKFLQRERAASDVEKSRQADYIRDEVAVRLCERLLDINRRFENVLDLGANACNIGKAMTLPNPDPDPRLAEMGKENPPLSSKIGHLLAADSAGQLLFRDSEEDWNSKINMSRKVIRTEEDLTDFQKDSFDAVLSSLNLHWINDLPSTLAQINNVLKSDAPLIAAMMGGDSLFELRTSLQLASMDRLGGLSPHLSPLADVKDVGGLLTKAGFKLLTVDIDDIVVEYPDIFALMMDLQAMGESNAVLGREMGPISRDVLLAAEAIYRELHGEDAQMGGLPATFRIIYLIGWKEGEGQSQPLERGSGEINMKDILGGGSLGNQ